MASPGHRQPPLASAGPSGTTSRKRVIASAGDEEDGEPPPERKKRAPTACRMCKSRKIKCSNDRPKCRSCVRLQCECLYPEDAHRSFQDEPARQILERLDEILARLPEHPARQPRPSQPGQGAGSGPNLDSFAPGRPVETASENTLEDDYSFPGMPDDVSEYTALDVIFRWPIFADTAAKNWPRRSPLFIVAQESEDNDMREDIHSVLLPHNDDAETPHLIDQFLTHVNIKNPILDRQSLLNNTRMILETGLSWDSRSCLVLIACALGAIAKPFVPSRKVDLDDPVREDWKRQRLKAEAFYKSAQRRFGLLDMGLTACQCHFLAGIYSMYTMRPVQAWRSFVQASTLYILYLRTYDRMRTSQNEHDPDDPDLALKSLEERLFWSCLKSECEINLEIFLPKSSLSAVDWPCMFPTVPASGTLEEEEADHLHSPNEQTGAAAPYATTPSTREPPIADVTDSVPAPLHEQSWFYYLTEISLLRLNNRIIQTFYSAEHTKWLELPALGMCNDAFGFQAQLQQWERSLPSSIKFAHMSPGTKSCSELQYATWGRYVQIKRLLYRPFLYRYMHSPLEDPAAHRMIQRLAESCVQACLDSAVLVGSNHRHHGTWFGCRQSATAALMLLGAGRAGLIQQMGRTAEAEYYLDGYIDHLKAWENESVDLKLARQVIEAMRHSGGSTGDQALSAL